MSTGCGTNLITSKLSCASVLRIVELVLRLRDDLVEAVVDGPTLLLFGQRAEMALAAPVAARSTYPLIENPATMEVHAVVRAARQGPRASDRSRPLEARERP
jgi:hypothetical protein